MNINIHCKYKLSFLTPQLEHFFELGNHLSTILRKFPLSFDLYSNCRLNSKNPKSEIACDSFQFAIIPLTDNLWRLSLRILAIL